MFYLVTHFCNSLWLSWPLWNIRVTNDHKYLPLVVSTSRSFSRSWLITGFVNRLTPRVFTSGAGTAYSSGAPGFTPVLVGFVLFDFSFIRRFCRSLFVLLFFFFWSLCCLFFFDIQILISPLISLNSSRGPFKWIQMCRSISLFACIYVVVGDPIIKGPGGSMNN